MMIGEDTRGSCWCNVYNTIYSHQEKFSTFSTIFNKSGLSPDFSPGEYNEPLPKCTYNSFVKHMFKKLLFVFSEPLHYTEGKQFMEYF